MELIKHEIGADNSADVEIRFSGSYAIRNRKEACEQLIDGAESKDRFKLRVVGLLTGLNGNWRQSQIPIHMFQSSRCFTVDACGQIMMLAIKLICQHPHGHSIATGQWQLIALPCKIIHKRSERVDI